MTSSVTLLQLEYFVAAVAFVTRSGSRLSPATQEMIKMAAELLRRTS
jgi:hypothetical protein